MNRKKCFHFDLHILDAYKQKHFSRQIFFRVPCFFRSIYFFSLFYHVLIQTLTRRRRGGMWKANERTNERAMWAPRVDVKIITWFFVRVHNYYVCLCVCVLDSFFSFALSLYLPGGSYSALVGRIAGSWIG